jgi:[ribosomal protein S18]-alanine N-acetyltransferase
MSLLDYFIKPAELSVLPMTISDVRDAADIHADAFKPAWTDGDIERLLARDHTYGRIARPVGGKTTAGFVLYTLVAGEGEILTIATHAAWRRRGIGEKLVKSALGHLSAERAEAMFLEVGDENAGALALYRKLGFREVGRRNNYYAPVKGAAPVKGTAPSTGSAALVMRRDLR